MKISKFVFCLGAVLLTVTATSFFTTLGSAQSMIETVLPDVKGWELSEETETYQPESLFEYINGAAEIYLAYDFRELSVGLYKIKDGEAELSVEIYDMGSTENAFGIYGAERFPESTFIPVGIQGYIEEDSLNFFAGRYYVKMLCFSGGAHVKKYLMDFSGSVASRVGEDGGFPALVAAFPAEGKIANSEKFSLRNFLGYSFLRNGFMAGYRMEDMEFDCFIIRAETEEESEGMLNQLLEKKKDIPLDRTKAGIHY
ncbi:MAG: hypothetical protein MUP70_06685, partial [Candidatus Aminicenantes bacterium]|nr:hypothetical protein [Candidatus Aminicenantes bacterium]